MRGGNERRPTVRTERHAHRYGVTTGFMLALRTIRRLLRRSLPVFYVYLIVVVEVEGEVYDDDRVEGRRESRSAVFSGE